ncbi:hypothetical protein GQ53DRAFT_821934 [Thozetella sp. PMI_491]|nr:hypothetical protein GQ53DRAFT_821934 [Thozetella sp. PMI_491]
MEIVIPPRDHAKSAYRYTWDENGEVTNVSKLSEQQRQQQPSPEQPSAIPERIRKGRQTVNWPFQSIVTETEISSPVTEHFARRATWQPKRRDADSDSVLRDIIPDYVINYIRGETPETVARRKQNKGALGERGVDVAHQHRYHQSRAAEFEGFYEDDTSRGSSPMQVDEERRLTGSGEKRTRKWGRITEGWRSGVAMYVLLAALILVAGVVSLIVAIARSSVSADDGVVYSGTCAMASNIGWGLHGAIGVFVIVLIAGANYAFQVLSSPTRPELGLAHSKTVWVDIGIPSVRNFAHIAGSRVFLAVILLLLALATQVIYNATIFTTQSAFDADLVFVTESFLKGAQFSNDTSNNAGRLTRLDILALQDLAARNQLVNLTTAKCTQQFSGAFQTDFRAALLVTNRESTASSLLQTANAASLANFRSVDSTNALDLDGAAVLYCLAQESGAEEQTCSVSLNGSLLGIVCVLNLIIVICAVFALTKRSFEPLVTLGDAIASFLKDPDPTTRGCCLMTKPDVWQGRWGLREAKYWVPSEHFWFKTPSLPRWVFVIFAWLAPAGLAAAALVLGMRADPSGMLSGFGSASSHDVYTLPNAFPISAATIVASLPQLLLAVLYFATNALLTTYYLSHESSLYALGQPRPLRVSADAEGHQFTSLYLTLPRPWSWFLVTLFAGMSFVLSQSVVLVSVSLTSATGTSRLIAIGFSGVGLLVFLALLVVLAVVVLGLGFRRAPAAVLVNGQAVGNPLVLPAGSCSAVFSARCHRIPGESDVWQYPVSWGVVHQSEGMDASHCTYTARGAAQLDIARSYA